MMIAVATHDSCNEQCHEVSRSGGQADVQSGNGNEVACAGSRVTVPLVGGNQMARTNRQRDEDTRLFLVAD